MNWKAFTAMLVRDVHVARRRLVTLLLQTLLQPLLFVFVFGKVLTESGLMSLSFKNALLPGIVSISMVLTGIQAVCLPLITEFQFTKEIEDRLLAPMNIQWVAIGKIISGMVQALLSGAVVLPVGWLLLDRQIDITFGNPSWLVTILVLIALFSASAGLALGCTIDQSQVGLLFSLVVAPMVLFGCAYYPWSALAGFPLMQNLVLLNPLVYASEGLRATLAPGVPHMRLSAVVIALAFTDVALIIFGLNQFQRRSIS